MIKSKQLFRQGCIVILAGIVLSTSACAATKTVQTAAMPKQIVEVQNHIIEAPGRIKVNDTRNIVLDFPAIVNTVLVKDGQQVEQGQTLITLDMHEIKEQIQDKENELRIQRLQLEKGQNGSNYNAEKELSELQTAQIELDRAKEDLQTKQSLYEGDAISEDELKTAQKKVQDAERKVADKQLSKADDYQIDLEIQRQRISGLETDLMQLRDKLRKSFIEGDKLVCDFKKGLVQELTRVAGDPIQANTKILSLANLDSMVVVADVSEDFIKDVRIGAAVDILPLADSSKLYKGKVLKIADMGQEKNGETIIQVEVSIDNLDEFIKPNFNVDVKISK